MHRLATAPMLAPLFGPAPSASSTPATPGDAILGILRGGQQADTLLETIKRGIAHPNALRDLVVSLASDCAALEGFCRAIQKRLEGAC